MALKREMPPAHPGEILREDVLPALDLSVQAAAAKLGVTRQTLHRIVARKNPQFLQNFRESGFPLSPLSA